MILAIAAIQLFILTLGLGAAVYALLTAKQSRVIARRALAATANQRNTAVSHSLDISKSMPDDVPALVEARLLETYRPEFEQLREQIQRLSARIGELDPSGAVAASTPLAVMLEAAAAMSDATGVTSDAAGALTNIAGGAVPTRPFSPSNDTSRPPTNYALRDPETLLPRKPLIGASINFSPRSRALKMLRRGDLPEQIAASLNMPISDVRLLAKLHRMMGASQTAQLLTDSSPRTTGAEPLAYPVLDAAPPALTSRN